MARVIGLLLMVAGIFLGISIYTQGTERTLAGWWGSEDAETQRDSEDREAVSPERERASPGQAAPSAITSRVRERVTGAIAEGTRRHGGD